MPEVPGHAHTAPCLLTSRNIYRLKVRLLEISGVASGSEERRARLGASAFCARETFDYEYDFSGARKHEVRVEKLLETDLKKTDPVCIGGSRACPSEDCGGSWGFMKLLHVLKDPSHPGYRRLREGAARTSPRPATAGDRSTCGSEARRMTGEPGCRRLGCVLGQGV